MAVNLTIVEGYLTAPPQQDYTNDGEPFINLRLGCHRDYFNKRQPYDFVSFRAFKKNMENILKYVSVGQCITIFAKNRSFLRHTEKRDYPVEFKEVVNVYFDKRKDSNMVPDIKQQEILDVIAKYDGFDENGLFPKEDENE